MLFLMLEDTLKIYSKKLELRVKIGHGEKLFKLAVLSSYFIENDAVF